MTDLTNTAPPAPVVCEDCADAAQAPHHGFRHGCTGCCARAAARSQHFAKVAKARDTRDWGYRELLRKFNLTHEQVKAAHAADALHAGRP
jgi:hypothetical protein